MSAEGLGRPSPVGVLLTVFDLVLVSLYATTVLWQATSTFGLMLYEGMLDLSVHEPGFGGDPALRLVEDGWARLLVLLALARVGLGALGVLPPGRRLSISAAIASVGVGLGSLGTMACVHFVGRMLERQTTLLGLYEVDPNATWAWRSLGLAPLSVGLLVFAAMPWSLVRELLRQRSRAGRPTSD